MSERMPLCCVLNFPFHMYIPAIFPFPIDLTFWKPFPRPLPGLLDYFTAPSCRFTHLNVGSLYGLLELQVLVSLILSDLDPLNETSSPTVRIYSKVHRAHIFLLLSSLSLTHMSFLFSSSWLSHPRSFASISGSLIAISPVCRLQSALFYFQLTSLGSFLLICTCGMRWCSLLYHPRCLLSASMRWQIHYGEFLNVFQGHPPSFQSCQVWGPTYTSGRN